MSGWHVMIAPLSILLKAGAIALVLLLVAGARLPGRAHPEAGLGSRRRASRRHRVQDGAIVSAYNHAILQGWPPGEDPTFVHVGRVVGTVPDHVRAVIARHWAG